MENEKPKRKYPRIKNYDYSAVGGYFITVCTLQRRNYFWENDVGACNSTNKRICYETNRFTYMAKIVFRPHNPQP